MDAKHLIWAALLACMTLFSASAMAICPATWNSDDCLVDGGAVTVCTDTSTTFSCDLSAADGASTITVVTTYDATYTIEAWGDYDGELFCCHSTAGWTGENVITVGSAYADTLRYTSTSGTDYLACATGSPNDPITSAQIYGGGGNDVIHGSEETDTRFIEELYGEPADDTVDGHAGDDYIEGGTGEDTLDGGAGGDEMYGGGGSDTMRGGTGDDFMYGQVGQDRMGGGDGDDTMDGGTDADIMCGDGEVGGDTLYAGDANDENPPDQIWSANASDGCYCQSNSTKWDTYCYDWYGICAGNPVLTDKPAACP